MNHDITHCKLKECPKSETCYRYLAYLEAKKLGMEYLWMFTSDHKIEGCKYYMENN